MERREEVVHRWREARKTSNLCSAAWQQVKRGT
jgi:hypothetical protein